MKTNIKHYFSLILLSITASFCNAEESEYIKSNNFNLYNTSELKTGVSAANNYYYESFYTIRGTIRSASEDLCETGSPEKYYYLQTAPLTVFPQQGDEISEKRTGVTKIQLQGFPSISKYEGKTVQVYGRLVFHIAGCHIHTDVYMIETQLAD